MAMLSREAIGHIGFASFGDASQISDRASFHGCVKIYLGSNVRVDGSCVLSAVPREYTGVRPCRCDLGATRYCGHGQCSLAWPYAGRRRGIRGFKPSGKELQGVWQLRWQPRSAHPGAPARSAGVRKTAHGEQYQISHR